MANNTLLEVKDLKMYFENKKGLLGKKVEYVKAVDGVSFQSTKRGNNRACRGIRMW